MTPPTRLTTPNVTDTLLEEMVSKIVKHFHPWKGSHHKVPVHLECGGFTPSGTPGRIPDAVINFLRNPGRNTRLSYLPLL
ncbi:MAG: hypothetical protein ACXQTY_03815 [Candidatus Methanogasteraceae archaeon]